MPPAPTGDPPRRSPRNGGAPSIDLTPPTIELPGGQGPGANEPQSKDASQGSSWRQSRGVRQASFEEPQNESHQPKPRPKGDRRVTQIVLDRRLTGGYNADRLLGDDGVTVFIEPRDEDDSLVHRAGEVSVVVIDPALSGAKARVARWDFSAAEIERHFQKTALGEGIMLKLEWPADLPLHERLMLFVRFISAGGDVLEASQPVLVDLGKADDDEADGSQLPKAHSTSWSPDR